MTQPTPKKRSRLAYFARLLTVGLVGGVSLACIAIEVYYIISVTNPAYKEICCTTPADQGFEYEDVSLTSQDGTQLSGWYIPSHNGAVVILLHGYGNRRTEMLDRAVILARHGYGALLYDLRGHGESGGGLRAFGWLDDQDVYAALDFLQARPEVDPGRIGILGFSVGGQIAIRAMAQDQRLSAILADDPGFVTAHDAPPPENLSEQLMFLVNWVDVKGVQLRTGIKPPAGVIEVIGQIAPRPMLIIATGNEWAYRMGLNYYNLAGEPKDFWRIPEAGHGGQVKARPAEYEERMIEFFDESLLE